MNIHEHLSAFDRWLTDRIEEAHARRKDLAFRDLAVDGPAGHTPWEYSLLEPGARSPHGEGWSVYRLHGVWPETVDVEALGAPRPASGGRKGLLSSISRALLGRGRPAH
jgi:hypothetical protein